MEERTNVTKKYFTESNLYILLAIVTGVLTVMVPLILVVSYAGGEYKQLASIAFAIEAIVWGFMIVSVLSMLVFKEWVKKYWYINLMLFVITAWILLSFYFQ